MTLVAQSRAAGGGARVRVRSARAPCAPRFASHEGTASSQNHRFEGAAFPLLPFFSLCQCSFRLCLVSSRPFCFVPLLLLLIFVGYSLDIR